MTRNRDSEYLKELGKRVKKARKDKKLSMDELAVLTGYNNRSSIACIETGRRGIPSEKIFLFAKILGISAYYLVTGVTSKETTITESDLDGLNSFINYVDQDMTDLEREILKEVKKMSTEEQEFLLKMISKK